MFEFNALHSGELHVHAVTTACLRLLNTSAEVRSAVSGKGFTRTFHKCPLAPDLF